MVFKRFVLATAVASAGFASVPSSVSAAVTLGTTSCSLTDLSFAATACSGFYEGNLVSGNSTALSDSAAIINSLLATSYTGSTLPIAETLPGLSGGSTINFSTPLYGQTVIAVHAGVARGQANSVGYQGTAFYVFDAGSLSGGTDTLRFNRPGLSNARLFSTSTPSVTTAVPEPATWAMMLFGFGFVGGAIRLAKRRQKVTVSYA